MPGSKRLVRKTAVLGGAIVVAGSLAVPATPTAALAGARANTPACDASVGRPPRATRGRATLTGALAARFASHTTTAGGTLRAHNPSGYPIDGLHEWVWFFGQSASGRTYANAREVSVEEYVPHRGWHALTMRPGCDPTFTGGLGGAEGFSLRPGATRVTRIRIRLSHRPPHIGSLWVGVELDRGTTQLGHLDRRLRIAA